MMNDDVFLFFFWSELHIVFVRYTSIVIIRIIQQTNKFQHLKIFSNSVEDIPNGIVFLSRRPNSNCGTKNSKTVAVLYRQMQFTVWIYAIFENICNVTGKYKYGSRDRFPHRGESKSISETQWENSRV